MELAAKPLLISLKIVHSELAKHVAPHILDESLSRAVKPALQKIEEDIQNLKLEDLKVSQDQLQLIIVRLQNKFAGEEQNSDALIKTLSEETESDLKIAQQSAMSGLHSGLGSIEQVDCIKVILMTECFRVLNILSSLHEIKPHERELFAAMLKNAQATCEIKLQQLNKVKEVSEYLAKRLSPESVKKLSLPRQLSVLGIGIDSSALAREAIAINFQVHFFFHYWHERLAMILGKENAKVNKNKVTSSGVEKAGTEFQDFVWVEASESSEASEAKNPVLRGENVDSVAAAISVLKQDEELAQMLEEYLLSLDHVEAMKRMDHIKNFLRQNKAVQKAAEKAKAKFANHVCSDQKKSNNFGPLDYLNRLAVMSTMEKEFTKQTSVGTDGETSIVVCSHIELVPCPLEKLSANWSAK